MSAHVTATRSSSGDERFAVGLLGPDEAAAHSLQLQSIFRDAVAVAGPTRYTAAQVAAWALGADDRDRWAVWLAEGSTWKVTEHRGERFDRARMEKML